MRNTDFVYVMTLTLFLRRKGAVILAVGICGMFACRWFFIGTRRAATSEPLPAAWGICPVLSDGGRHTFPTPLLTRQAEQVAPFPFLSYCADQHLTSHFEKIATPGIYQTLSEFVFCGL